SRWAKAGLKVFLGSRDAGRAQKAAAELNARIPGDRIRGLVNEEAAAATDLVVVTVPFSAQAGIYKSIAEHVRAEAIVIDCTVPVAANVGGKVTHTLGVWEGSAAQHAQSFLPKGTKIAAAFHSLSAVALNDIDAEMEGDVLVCGAKATKEPVKELVHAIAGLRFVDAGPLENARIVEPITALLIGINHRYDTDRAGIHITGI
ncbi:MAG: 8-hydroxy-5-deazaflavin:NADPH oxidoreductase, partial [Actinomycetota bacterium]|nr:8-hydroxy-5-deazaflavin:NADPH oxidoreductase [Actinomycetota bacterium]